MSKKESLTRYNLIVQKLRRFPASYDEIKSHLKRESDIQGYNFSVSKRTFFRDIKDIYTIYGIEIIFNKLQEKYRIEDNGLDSNLADRMLDAFDVVNTFHISDNLSQYVCFEKRKPQGTENLHGLLHAIKNKLQVKFTYQKYWEDSTTLRTAEPYALKEFKNRWYVMAKDLKDSQVKSFALDRLYHLEITQIYFQSPIDFDVNKHFSYCFGIISPNAKHPEKVVLSFTSHQGKYVKSLPLHSSQQILIDTDTELRIQLTVFLTYDFLMELLSMGENVKVISPKKLIDNMRETLQDALKQYE